MILTGKIEDDHMRRELFEDLFDSVQEGVSILKGEKEPSRTIVLNVPDKRTPRKEENVSD
jgi:hypothetical protein